MPVRFVGDCTPHVGYQFRVGSLDLGPFTVAELTQHETYCEADLAPMAFRGWWENVEGMTSEMSEAQTYPVVVTVPEPGVVSGVVAGLVMLLVMRSRRSP